MSKIIEDPVITSVVLPRAVIEQLDRIAARQLRSRSKQVTHVLQEWLSRSDSAAPPRERK